MRLSLFAIRNLLRRPARVIVLVVAVLLVATGFAFLTSQVQTTQILVRGTLNKAFRPAYDLLVLPKKTETKFEQTTGLVDENYLSGLFGGISEKQLGELKAIPGVSLAAPIAMVGYALLRATVKVSLAPVLSSTIDQAVRVRPTWIADDGLSRYPGGGTDPTQYYYRTSDPLVATTATNGNDYPAQVAPGTSVPAQVCAGYYLGQPASSGYSPLYCESPLQSGTAPVSGTGFVRQGDGDAATVSVVIPVLLAAVDPHAEQELVDLKGAMTSGKYLGEDEGELGPIQFGPDRWKEVPVIASDRTYLEEALSVSLQRLSLPEGTALVEAMTKPTAYKLLTTAKSADTKTVSVSAARAYRDLLSDTSFFGKGTFSLFQYYTTSQVRYRTVADRLAPVPVHLPARTWTAPSGSLYRTGADLAPPGGDDTAFRQVTTYVANSHNAVHNVLKIPLLKVVGTFNPTKLESFSKLSHVPLQTFFPPLAYGENARSKKLLHTRPLGPTTDIAGYLSEPPLLITTLKAAKPFFNDAVYSAASTTFRPGLRNPISAIQIRVSGLSGATDKSFQRLRDIAVAIEKKTGLTVEITAGSSPKKVTIDLPKGKFGRPVLELAQGWVKTNTAAMLLKGIDKESLSLWALLLIVCALFVGNAVVADLRGRRKELATLVTMGWSRGELTHLALFEVAAIGLVAGVSVRV